MTNKRLIRNPNINYLTSGIAQLDASASGKMGSRALLYYFGTTICAAFVGICCVVTIHPGNPSMLKKPTEEISIISANSQVTTLDAILDIIR